VQEAPAKPAESVSFQIETAKIPAPQQEPEKKPVEQPEDDYSDLIMPEETELVEKPEEESNSGGIDIMALLSAQAKKMENISSIEMMELYGEIFTEVTLEELEKYINKHHK
jgi:hypothetical protein